MRLWCRRDSKGRRKDIWFIFSSSTGTSAIIILVRGDGCGNSNRVILVDGEVREGTCWVVRIRQVSALTFLFPL